MPHGSPTLRAEGDTPQPGDDESTVVTSPRSPAARRWRLAATTAIAGATGFVTLALLMPRATIAEFDGAVLRAMRRLDDPNLPIGGRLIADGARDVTALGGTLVLALVVVFVAGYFAFDRRGRDAVAVLATSIGGGCACIALKLAFGRDRPDVVPHLMVVDSDSFPSGHAMLSAVIYCTLGALLARFAKHRGAQVLPIVGAMLLTFLVGCSRLVLGVHYPTDVLAGWTAGATWAALSWLAVDRLARQHTIEGRERDSPPRVD
ncbi:MAG: phosphatase PAP2 family protein [Planctomycetes bacterium]|nr:phosphatase PAP2 family protein [Planctomycetota bacterium]